MFGTDGREYLWRGWEVNEELPSNNFSNPRTSRDLNMTGNFVISLEFVFIQKSCSAIQNPYLEPMNTNSTPAVRPLVPAVRLHWAIS